MKKVWNAFKVVAFLVVCFVCLTVVSKILAYEHEMEPDLTMKEFYNLEDDVVQMLIVGSSHTELAFSPMECYKQHKITSYNFSTAKQPIELSYHLMAEAVKTQNPKVVIYDVASLFYDRNDVSIARFRYVLDSMPLSKNKVLLANCYANYNENEKIFSVAEALCPIYYYHDRWKKLDQDDFNVDEATSHLMGQFMRTYITEMEYDQEKIEKKLAKKIENGTAEVPTISENNMNYLLKMKKLCDDNNMKLLLITTPTVRWNSLKSKAIQEICNEHGMDFVDLNLPDGQLIDYATEMADGNHVNAYGSIKTTTYLSDYVINNYGLTGSEDEYFEESIKYYDGYDNILKYHMETDFTEYMNMLNENKENLVVLISANGEITAGLYNADRDLLHNLGCTVPFDATNAGSSYGAVVDGGKLVKEVADAGEVLFYYPLTEKTTAAVLSKGTTAGNEAAINLGEAKLAINGNGINIVVFDKISNKVLDSVCFDTSTPEKKWYRGEDKELEISMFKAYRDWVLENY